jgi:K+-sensing histidine kinase KdpD
MGPESSEDGNDDIPWKDVVHFVRQLSHDLRNHLNAAELQSAYISELTDDGELKTEIKRLREIVSGLGKALQKLTADLGQIKTNLMMYRAADFVEDLRKKMAQDFAQESAAIHWDVGLEDAVLNVDPQLLQQALLEVFTNAFQHDRGPGEIVVTAKIDSDRFAFTLREPKTKFDLSTEKWGREPFRQVDRGHYGLGLNRARSIVDAHDGELRAHYDPETSTLVTTITLPLSKGEL